MKFFEVFPPEQARAVAAKLSNVDWAAGRARKPELEGGVKNNSEITSHVLLESIGKRLMSHPEIQLETVPLKAAKPKFSRYAGGQHYSLHTDAPWMGETRTDLSCTLWLSDGYEGGELVIGGERFKGEPGQCLIYRCGLPHEVTPVTDGERICAVTWIQSRIRDPYKRAMITDFRRFLGRFEEKDPEAFVEGSRVYSDLLRMWIE